MTQADLARAAGVDQPNISAIENGRRIPTIDTARTLVEACGYELCAVAGDEVVFEAPGHTPPPPPQLSEDERRRTVVAVLELADAIVRSR